MGEVKRRMKFITILLSKDITTGFLYLTALFLGHQIGFAKDISDIDVLHYQVRLEFDLPNGSIQGVEVIHFKVLSDTLNLAQFDLEDLLADSIKLNERLLIFTQKENHLNVFSNNLFHKGENIKITVYYHGKPIKGLIFFKDKMQLYTAYWTSSWMVCKEDPSDRATLNLDLVLPTDLTVIANGEQIKKVEISNNLSIYSWIDKTPVPSYLFGFAAGKFKVTTKESKEIVLKYLSTDYSLEEIDEIFSQTQEMFNFFEEKAGVKYSGRTYTQVLVEGEAEQELNNVTFIRKNYGLEVLRNQHLISLGAHELAHQWWGNMVTCESWNHFWLNEGFATFMTAAYKEHKFGRSAYLKAISISKERYERVRKDGGDKSLIFSSWTSPTNNDRTLVYHKGAYVIHLLREKLGEEVFWKGIKSYTQTNFNKSVTTMDFKNAMEKVSKEDLKSFFDMWVFLK